MAAAPVAPPDTPTEAAPTEERQVRAGLLIGAVSGLTGIMCCVSPVVAVLLGIATAAQGVTLGDNLFYNYGWYFRGAGALVGVTAVVLHLRRRGACSVEGALRYRRMLAVLAGTALATYVGLFWFTKYLGIWFGDS